MQASKPFAEVIESSLQGWQGQSWQWDDYPAFGALMAIEAQDRKLFGLVYQVQTGSMDPSRHPCVYQKTEAELRAEQPQIFALLKTTFSCIIIGYEQAGVIYPLLAREPAKIHAFIYPASNVQCQKVFASNQYLHILFGAAGIIGMLDELLLATLGERIRQKLLTHEALEDFIHTFSLLIGNDYRRLKLFLQRVQYVSDKVVAPTGHE